METELLLIDENKFYDEFKPIKNHLDNNASWDGMLFETFGEELDFCFKLAQKENRVWTIIECDNEEYEYDDEDEENDLYEPTCLHIISGFHYVNRVGFFVTENPYTQDTEVKIDI